MPNSENVTTQFLDYFTGKHIFVSMPEATRDPDVIKHYHSSFNDCKHDLSVENAIKLKAIYFTVNELDRSLQPDKKRTKKMWVRSRAIWCEDDLKREKPRTDWPIVPNLVVQSSAGKFHYYWLTSTENKEEWVGVQTLMVDQYGSDPQASKDVNRVLRLPGFNHNKKDPVMVEYVETRKAPYDWEKIKQAFPPIMSYAIQQSEFDRGTNVWQLAQDYQNGHLHGPSSSTAMYLANLGASLDNIEGMLALMFPDVAEHSRKSDASTAYSKVRQERQEKEEATEDFGFIRADKLIKNRELTQWAIKNYVPEGKIIGLIGPAYTFKTFILLSWMLSVATGEPWFGNKVKEGKAFLIQGEGKDGMASRMLAWSIDKNIDLEGVGIYISTVAAHLSEKSNAKAVGKQIGKLILEHGEPAMIGIDTLARNFGEGEENSNSDMNKFITHLDKYLRVPFNATVVVVHHTGHENKKRGRGASSLYGALDAEYLTCAGEGNNGSQRNVKLRCTKQKDSFSPDVIYLQSQIVELPPLKDKETGEIITETSLVLKRVQRKLNQPVGINQKLLVSILTDGSPYSNKIGMPRHVLLEKYLVLKGVKLTQPHSDEKKDAKNVIDNAVDKNIIRISPEAVQPPMYSI